MKANLRKQAIALGAAAAMLLISASARSQDTEKTGLSAGVSGRAQQSAVPQGGSATAGVFAPVKDSEMRPITAGGFVKDGPVLFNDIAKQAGLTVWHHTMGTPDKKYILEATGSGVALLDYDNDGWLDILICNGHVYPEVEASHLEAPYAERKYLYRNLRNGQFEEVTKVGGNGITNAAAARGCAFGDYDNDGDIDVVVNCVNSLPQLLRCDSTIQRNWIKIRTVGTKSNRSGIGTRVVVTSTPVHAEKPFSQMDEVRSGGSYYSQNDLRLHFGLDSATKAETVVLKWPSGTVDTLKNLEANHLYVVQEGGKLLKTVAFGPGASKSRK